MVHRRITIPTGAGSRSACRQDVHRALSRQHFHDDFTAVAMERDIDRTASNRQALQQDMIEEIRQHRMVETDPATAMIEA